MFFSVEYIEYGIQYPKGEKRTIINECMNKESKEEVLEVMWELLKNDLWEFDYAEDQFHDTMDEETLAECFNYFIIEHEQEITDTPGATT